MRSIGVCGGESSREAGGIGGGGAATRCGGAGDGRSWPERSEAAAAASARVRRRRGTRGCPRACVCVRGMREG